MNRVSKAGATTRRNPPDHFQPPALTDEQRRIKKSKANRKIISAGPGCGKTTLLQAIIRDTLSRHSPQKILCLTFGKSANEEMALRFGDDEAVESKTTHAFGYRLVQTHYERLNFSDKPTFHDNDADTIEAMIEPALARLCLPKKISQALKSITRRALSENLCSPAIAWLAKTHDPVLTPHLKFIRELRKTYLTHCQTAATISYNQQITLALHLLNAESDILASVGRQYCLMVVDEFQDLTGAQIRLIQLLASAIPKTVVVGDEDQSIYGFRGASGNALSRFARRFSDANTDKLTVSHRCSQPILDVANAIRQDMPGRVGAKVLRSTNTAARAKPQYYRCGSPDRQDRKVLEIVRDLIDKKGVEPRKIAVLARSKQNFIDAARYRFFI